MPGREEGGFVIENKESLVSPEQRKRYRIVVRNSPALLNLGQAIIDGRTTYSGKDVQDDAFNDGRISKITTTVQRTSKGFEFKTWFDCSPASEDKPENMFLDIDNYRAPGGKFFRNIIREFNDDNTSAYTLKGTDGRNEVHIIKKSSGKNEEYIAAIGFSTREEHDKNNMDNPNALGRNSLFIKSPPYLTSPEEVLTDKDFTLKARAYADVVEKFTRVLYDATDAEQPTGEAKPVESLQKPELSKPPKYVLTLNKESKAKVVVISPATLKNFDIQIRTGDQEWTTLPNPYNPDDLKKAKTLDEGLLLFSLKGGSEAREVSVTIDALTGQGQDEKTLDVIAKRLGLTGPNEKKSIASVYIPGDDENNIRFASKQVHGLTSYFYVIYPKSSEKGPQGDSAEAGSWHGVVGQTAAVEQAKRAVEAIANYDKFKEVGANPPRGVLLYGPPGTGKTLIAHAIAEEAGAVAVDVPCAEMDKMYLGQSQEKLQKYFHKAYEIEKTGKPVIMVFDELNALAPPRGDKVHEVTNKLVTILLQELQKINDNHPKIAFVATTNNSAGLDDAVKRAGRFTFSILCDIPQTPEEVKAILNHRLNEAQRNAKKQILSDNLDLNAISERSLGANQAALVAAVDIALSEKVHRNLTENTSWSPLTTEELLGGILQQFQTDSLFGVKPKSGV